jgi:hypothetical protein
LVAGGGLRSGLSKSGKEEIVTKITRRIRKRKTDNQVNKKEEKPDDVPFNSKRKPAPRLRDGLE